MNKIAGFNQKLINAIENAYPKKNDQIRLLTNAIYLGKEASYRRLRGEVLFSFSEACTLARILDLSLDEIAMTGRSETPVFELKIHPTELVKYGYQKLEEHEHTFEMMMNGSVELIQSASSLVPYSFLFLYENLAKFRHFKWRYQTESKLIPGKFSEMEVPPEIIERQKSLGKNILKLPENTIIFDRNMFISFAKEFQFFHKSGLISDADLQKLKDEFIELIEYFESLAIYGQNNLGNKIWLYMLNIDFEFNYAYIKGRDFEYAYMDGIYMMDTIMSSDPDICRLHHKWINSLRKYATLISVSGEKQRREFFDKQKQFIETI